MKKSKKTIRQIVSVLMAVVMVLLATPLSGILGMGIEAFAQEKSIASAPGSLADYIVGDIVEFGSYPQTKVTDTYTLAMLNDKDLTWKSYGYYSGSDSYGTMTQGDWMKYADTTYAGEKYRAVKFSQYRPRYTRQSSNMNNSYQDENGYKINTIYWFKYDPLKWKVLDPATGLVMCESIIDAQAYSNTVYVKNNYWYNDSTVTKYASDYYTSSIRNWLNDDFYNLAFSAKEKECMVLYKNLDNSSPNTAYSSDSTTDYVFLMSYYDIKKSEYGFSTTNSSDTARAVSATDYTKAQGIYNASGKSSWLLRTAYRDDSLYYVGTGGSVEYGFRSDEASAGIRPAIRVPNLETPVIPVKSITVTPSELTLKSGTSYQLTATVLPENATNKNVTWKSNYTAVAVVDENGLVTAKVPGTATITATTQDRGEVATCVITVPEKGTPVTSVSVSAPSASLTIGETYQLYASVTPSNATDKKVNWSSNDISVATVSSSGKITAVSEGTAIITATSVDGGHTATCVVTVSKAPVRVTGITVSPTSKSLTVGNSYQLSATVSPSDATNKNITWISSNNSVATVSSTGRITAVSEGTATITAITDDGAYRATCVVTVSKPTVWATGVTVTPSSKSMYVGETYWLTATVSPSDATNKSVTWKSSDTSVATVDSTGYVRAISAGTATITATTIDGGYTATCVITVTPAVPVTGISLEFSSESITVGDSLDLGFFKTISPSNATNKRVTWNSSNTDVAKVNLGGGVIGVSVGTAIITATTDDGGYTATCVVTVRPVGAVTGVRLNSISKEIHVGKTEKLYATVSPRGATNQVVTWSSSNTNVATVDSTGEITPKAAGIAIITVTTEDGGYTATCEVTVIEEDIYVNGVTVSPPSRTINIGEIYQLAATVSPSNATNKYTYWRSSNTNVATVDYLGNITGISEGTATITVTTYDGGYTATCRVTVSNTVVTVYVSGVSLEASSKTINIGETYQLTATVSPGNAANKGVTWKSSNSSVATVDSTGRVTAKSSGSAIITATTVDGGYTATCVVTVSKAKVTGVELTSYTEMIYNRTEKLYFEVSQTGRVDYTYKFTSSNNSVATVDSNGNVTSVGKGTAQITITVIDANGNTFTDTCDVTVKFNFGQWLLFIFCFGWIWM